MKKFLLFVAACMTSAASFAQISGGWDDWEDFDPKGVGSTYGTYTFDNSRLKGTDVYKVQVRQNLENENRWQVKVVDFGKDVLNEGGVDLIIGWNKAAGPLGKANCCYIEPVVVTNDPANGGDITLMDFVTYEYNEGTVNPDDDNYGMPSTGKYGVGCAYNPDLFRFELHLGYCVNSTWGYFDVYQIGYAYTNEFLEMGAEDPNATDAISTVNVKENKGNGAIYNLAGQRISESDKGIVIKNGRKYVIK